MKNNCHDICKNNISSLSWGCLQVYSDVPSRTVTGISVNTSFASAWFNPSSQPLLEVYRKTAACPPPCFQIFTENPSFASQANEASLTLFKSWRVTWYTALVHKRQAVAGLQIKDPCPGPHYCHINMPHNSQHIPPPYSFLTFWPSSPASETKIDGFYLMVSPSLQWLIAVPLLFQSLYFPSPSPTSSAPSQLLRIIRDKKTTAQRHPCLLRKGSKSPTSGRVVKCLNLAGMNLGLDHQSRE